MDKLSAMQTFAAVVKSGSFTGAASALGLPKARVSQRVADLEQHLGVRLLQRTTRALSLTEDGQAYLTTCVIILQDIDELEGSIRGGIVEPKGKLRVEALVSVARWILAPRLHDFQERYPKISVRLGASDRLSHLLEDGLDCAIRGGHLEASGQIARHVCDVSLGLYASPSYINKSGMPRQPAELNRHHLLSWFSNTGNPFAWQIISDDLSHQVESSYGLSFDDPDVAIASCVAGAGICPGAPFAVESWLNQGLLVPVLPKWAFAPRPVHIIYPSKKHLPARVRCFVEWALDIMKADGVVSLTPSELAERCRLEHD
ncbi:LysR family transcriptional regulator [Pseudomonas sp. NMI4491_12]|uniref:LysR family transcriptional regulator n=1 Tax=Pseudomonas sp. NMI4491_12 TaxID=2903146 RepID=UPI001E5C6277|nr:LysR family transcriptional regulator [Pseudomonas sp. NMI4491_12]MCE0968872.1 LysR family transcriptional regulator [Pseudomonas sp. NMI4491_12]